MENRVFRKLQVSDLEKVLEMNHTFRSDFIQEENARVFLSNPTNWIFACVENQKVIGFAYGYELNRLDAKGNMLYIHEVGVLPEYQRQGIAQQLLLDLKTVCRLNGIGRFFLFTERHNEPACALYEKAGGAKNSSGLEDDVVYFFIM